MIEVNHYGELIAKVTGGLLWSYKEYGSYQGDYIALIYKDRQLLIYKGYYGSCSGCDWLADYSDGIPEEDAKEYLEEYPSFLEIPIEALPKTIEDLKTLLPANTRTDFESDWDDDPKLKDLLKQIKDPDERIDNLDIIELEAARKGLI